MKQLLSKAIKHWRYVAPILKYPKNSKEFDNLVVQLDTLLELVGHDEKHVLIGLIDVLGNLIAAYEQKNFPAPPIQGVNALKFLMDTNHLQQSDLPEIASQGVISEILRGKRALNLRQIKLLSERFHVSPVTFIDD